MIISHEHRFVFVKTRKTAGTSVEVFLERVAGDDAIVTPIWPKVPGHVARNYMVLDNPLRARVLQARQRRLSGDSRERPAYFNHIAARNIRKRLGRRRWNSYYKFCFERNPWEKVVSEYFWRAGNSHQDGDLRDFVMRGDFPSDFDKYSVDGRTIGSTSSDNMSGLPTTSRPCSHTSASRWISRSRERRATTGRPGQTSCSTTR